MYIKRFTLTLLILALLVPMSGCITVSYAPQTNKGPADQGRSGVVDKAAAMDAEEKALNGDCKSLWDAASVPDGTSKSKSKLALVRKDWGLQQLFATVGSPTSKGKCTMIIQDCRYNRTGTVLFYRGLGYVVTDWINGNVLRVYLDPTESGFRPETVFLNSANAFEVNANKDRMIDQWNNSN